MAGFPGAARLALADGVVHLDPASAVFEAMLEGWATRQRARFLKDNMIGPRLELVRRFAAFTNQYPWQWEPAEAEAFITCSPVAVSTARNYQNALRLFCGYASDAPATGGWPGAWSSSGRRRGRSSMSGTRSRM
jgi:integrase/recombinase XerD